MRIYVGLRCEAASHIPDGDVLFANDHITDVQGDASQGPPEGLEDDCSGSDAHETEQRHEFDADESDDGDQTGPPGARCTSAALLQYVDVALEKNAALSLKVQRIIHHV